MVAHRGMPLLEEYVRALGPLCLLRPCLHAFAPCLRHSARPQSRAPGYLHPNPQDHLHQSRRPCALSQTQAYGARAVMGSPTQTPRLQSPSISARRQTRTRCTPTDTETHHRSPGPHPAGAQSFCVARGNTACDPRVDLIFGPAIARTQAHPDLQWLGKLTRAPKSPKMHGTIFNPLLIPQRFTIQETHFLASFHVNSLCFIAPRLICRARHTRLIGDYSLTLTLVPDFRNARFRELPTALVLEPQSVQSLANNATCTISRFCFSIARGADAIGFRNPFDHEPNAAIALRERALAPTLPPSRSAPLGNFKEVFLQR